jgi:hypothetical protein
MSINKVLSYCHFFLMCLALDIFRAFLLGFIIRSSNVNRIEVGGIPSRVKAEE